MSRQWNISWEDISPESASRGEVEDLGPLVEGLSLRAALSHTTFQCCSEPSTNVLGEETSWRNIDAYVDYATMWSTTYTLHIPRHITKASRIRLNRYLYGTHIYKGTSK